MTKNIPQPSQPPCPVCKKPVEPAYAPFCSAVCRDRDLISWLDERYVLAGQPGFDDEDG